MKINSTSDFHINSGLKVLIYGDSGSGKTALCSTTDAPTLILSAESGLLSLKDHNIDYINLNSMKDVREAYHFVSTSEEAAQYSWICIDSLSEIAEMCLAEEMRMNKDPRKAYGELNNKMMALIKAFRDMPNKNIYMSAKLTQEKDEYSGAMLFGPMMPGRTLSAQLPYMFDEVFYLKRELGPDKEKSIYLLTSQDFNARAKDRSGKLDVYEAPSLSSVYKKIMGDK